MRARRRGRLAEGREKPTAWAWPPKRVEERGVGVAGCDGGEGVEQVEAGDGAAGAVGLAVGVGEDEGGAAGAVDDAGGEDAEDAAMPVGVVEDEAFGGVGAGRSRRMVTSCARRWRRGR